MWGVVWCGGVGGACARHGLRMATLSSPLTCCSRRCPATDRGGAALGRRRRPVQAGARGDPLSPVSLNFPYSNGAFQRGTRIRIPATASGSPHRKSGSLSELYRCGVLPPCSRATPWSSSGRPPRSRKACITRCRISLCSAPRGTLHAGTRWVQGWQSAAPAGQTGGCHGRRCSADHLPRMSGHASAQGERLCCPAAEAYGWLGPTRYTSAVIGVSHAFDRTWGGGVRSNSGTGAGEAADLRNNPCRQARELLRGI